MLFLTTILVMVCLILRVLLSRRRVLVLQILLVLRVIWVHLRMRIPGLRSILLGMKHVWMTCGLGLSVRLSLVGMLSANLCVRVILLHPLRLLLGRHHGVMLGCRTGSWNARRILSLLTGRPHQGCSIGVTRNPWWSHALLMRRRHDGRVHTVRRRLDGRM